jgi:hypothetical protein
MRRRIAIVALAFGTVLGFGSGIAHVALAHHTHCAAHCPAEHSGDSP